MDMFYPLKILLDILSCVAKIIISTLGEEKLDQIVSIFLKRLPPESKQVYLLLKRFINLEIIYLFYLNIFNHSHIFLLL